MTARPVHATAAQREAARRHLDALRASGSLKYDVPRAIRLPVAVEEAHAALVVRQAQLQREVAR